MDSLSRRSVLRSSLALAAAGTLARPYIANAAATTAEVWWNQGFAQEEDVAFKKLVADYEKASSDKIDYSLVPNAPLRQKEISAIESGGVPGIALDDIIEPEKSRPHCQPDRPQADVSDRRGYDGGVWLLFASGCSTH